MVKYHPKIIRNKYVLTKNIWYYKIIFRLTTIMQSLKLSFTSAENRVNLNIFTVTLLTVCQMTQCIVLIMQFLYLWRSKGLGSVVNKWKKVCHNIPRKPDTESRELLSKRCYIGSPWNHRKFEESLNIPHIIPQHLDETLNEQQTKYPKIVKTLDRILYLIGKQGFLIYGHRKKLQTVTPCEIQKIF